MESHNYTHYVRLDGDGNIVYGFSDAFEEAREGDVAICENGGYQFRLRPDGEENPALTDGYGVPLYRYVPVVASESEPWLDVRRRADWDVQADRSEISRQEPESREPTARDILELFAIQFGIGG